MQGAALPIEYFSAAGISRALVELFLLPSALSPSRGKITGRRRFFPGGLWKLFAYTRGMELFFPFFLSGANRRNIVLCPPRIYGNARARGVPRGRYNWYKISIYGGVNHRGCARLGNGKNGRFSTLEFWCIIMLGSMVERGILNVCFPLSSV